ncbi:MAG: hypothetical protein ICV83_03335 [Cytophagales bacterium]|nr:hypothetical protein [Cytophagales bacterium]
MAVMFTSHHFYFPGADSVEYGFSSDMLNSSRYGKGRYRIAGNQLILRFDEASLPPSLVRATAKAADGDSLHLFFNVKGTFLDGRNQSLAGCNVLIQDAAQKTITGTIIPEVGTARLQLARNSAPRRVVFSSIGWQSAEHALNDADVSFDVLLQPYRGEVYPAGKEITFGIAKMGGDRLVLKRGKDRIVFVKK